MAKSSFIDLISSVAGAANTVASAPEKLDRVEAQVEEVKEGAIAYAGISLTLQLIATGAACVLAYVALKNLKKKRGT